MNREGGNGNHRKFLMLLVVNLATAELAYLGFHICTAFDCYGVRADRVCR